MNNNLSGQIFKLDYGTKVSSVPIEEIEVKIHPDVILYDFAQAYCKELNRRNAERYKASELNPDDLGRYFEGLLALRVQSVSTHGMTEWRRAKNLFIPSWIEFAISRVGVVIDNSRGLKFIPVMNLEVDMSYMLDISDVLQTFRQDGVTMHKDAFPRTDEGDYEVMSMAIIDGFVRTHTPASHPISSYVAAFLGFSITKELDFKMLYRVKYDDIHFIREMLLSEEAIR